MEDTKKYIVAVDLGSSHISAAAGHRDESGRFVVDAVETAESKDAIKRGRIINVSDVAFKLSLLFHRLETRLSPSKISKAYVGVSGQSIRSLDYPVVRTISMEAPIDATLLDELEMEARNRVLENGLVVFDVIPGDFKVDGRSTEKPCGEYGSEIRASYRLIVGNEIHKRNIEKAFEQAQMPIAGYICTIHASASAVLSDEERRQGCALIDFGAETTTLALYKEGSLVAMLTIPLGGNNITRDITSLHVKESEAETIKKAYQPQSDASQPVDWDMKDYYFDFSAEEIEEVITSRMGEIVANVKAQIANLSKKCPLSAGITLIGGASLMKGQKQLLAKETSLGVYNGTLFNISLPQGINGIASVQVIGLLQMGREVCAEPPVVEKKAEPAAPVVESKPLFPEEEPVKEPQNRPDESTETKAPLWKKFWDKVSEEMDKEN